MAIDFETANRYRDSACAVGMVRVDDGVVTGRRSWLIRPKQSFFEFTHIHGITLADVMDSPSFDQVWAECGELLGGAEFLAAHNASFDRSVLQACCLSFHLPVPRAPFLCSMAAARQIWNLRPTRLSDVCAFLNLRLKHHDALSDADACAQIMLAAARHAHSRRV
ncbi:MAG: 3'-5' exonuclease [Verrucomicrobiae bacterium]|nr:3'-5' exonuclease [Verrucomicrobiae bacterium]